MPCASPATPLSPGYPTPFRAFRAPDPRLTNPRRPHPPFRTRLPYPPGFPLCCRLGPFWRPLSSVIPSHCQPGASTVTT